MKREDLEKSILSYNQGGEFDIEKINLTIIDEADIIIYELERKNKQKLLCMALKTSTKLDSWFWLIPTELQMKSIIDHSVKLLQYYNNINDKNNTSILNYL